MGREAEFMDILLHKLIELRGKLLKAVCCSALCDFHTYREADKYLAPPGSKQATATEDFEFHVSYL
jgi:hypothetical protein